MIALAYFIPILMGAGGNIGSQSSTLVIRALATGELILGQWWKVLVREACAGCVIGTVLGTTAFFIAILLLHDTMLGVTVCTTEAVLMDTASCV